MKKRTITFLLALLSGLGLTFGLSACDEKECTHEWGEWSVSVPATCSAQGTKQRKCSLCEETQSDYIDIAAHIYDMENIVWTWNGYETAVATLSCTMDNTHARQINANITNEITTSATCVESGVKTYTATIKLEGVTYTATKNETIAALGHIETIDEAVAATCETTGLTEGSHCSVCNQVVIAQQETAKASHTEAIIQAIAATCSAEGATEGKKCSVCDEILVAPQPTNKIAHIEETIYAVSATCAATGLTEGKKCSICNEILVAQQPTDKIPHTETTVMGISPSCSAEGLTAGKKCSVCQEITLAQEPIEKLPHTEENIAAVSATCESTGLTAGKKCSVCQEVLVAQMITQKVAHNYVPVVTAPLCEAEGFTTHTCSMCDDSYVDSPVDALGHTWGEWEVSGSYTIRNCTNECNCGKSQRIMSISASYNGIRLLTGESVWKDDVTVVATLMDSSEIELVDFTLENDVMTLDGSNYVTVNFYTLSTSVAVPAIYNNLPGTTADTEFTYTVSGDAVTITGFVGNSTDIVLPAYITHNSNRIPVRNIARDAFVNNATILSIVIPNSITEIGRSAFENCTRMKTLTLGTGLTTIGSEAFKSCISLTEVVIPKNVITIDGYWGGAFEGCTSLKKVTIGDDSADLAVTTIGESTFAGCTSLEEVFIGNQVKSIGNSAFKDCTAMKTLTIGSQVQTIGENAFANGENLEVVNIPNSVTEIGRSAFENCTRMKTLTLGTGLTTIGSEAFKSCISLTEVVIPKNVITIDGYWGGAFEGCTSLKKVTIGDDSENLAVTTIGQRTFANCTSLVEVFIGSHVLSIEENAFEGCIQLEKVDFGTGAQSVGFRAFQGCTALTSVTIPANIMTIGSEVFRNCTSLTEVIIEKRNELFRSFGDQVFYGCSNFDRIYYTGTADDWAEIDISQDNEHPLNITPYYYSSTQPTAVGNYWYYNGSGNPRVWNVSDIAFKAEYSAENFTEIFGGEDSSYATIFFNSLKDDSVFQAGLRNWEALHMIADTSFSEGVWKVSKKDLYKLVIYDLLCGEANAQETILSGLESSTYVYLDDFAKEIFGSEVTEDFLKTTAPNLNYSAKLAKYGITGIQYIFEKHSNMYDALMSCATYMVLADMDESFQTVLLQIANDSSNPYDLRNAAREYAEVFQMSTGEILSSFAADYASADARAALTIFSDLLWDKTVEVLFPQFGVAQTAAKGVLFLADLGWNVDGIYNAYYKLDVAVHLEDALRDVIHNTLPDYYRVSNYAKAETYVYSIDMYKTSVLLGFDYSNAFLSEYAQNLSDEEKAECASIMSRISSLKQEKESLYAAFDNLVRQAKIAYYA